MYTRHNHQRVAQTASVLMAGFTLMELMVTVAIIGIVTAMSFPFFESVLQNTQLKTNAQTFLTALALTRTEAVRRGTQVTLCASATGTSCTGAAWTVGWVIFTDPDNDQTVDAGETIIRVNGALAGVTTTLTSTAFVNSVSYLSTGFTSGVTSGSFSLCDDRGATRGKSIQITTTGRAKSTGAPTSC